MTGSRCSASPASAVGRSRGGSTRPPGGPPARRGPSRPRRAGWCRPARSPASWRGSPRGRGGASSAIATASSASATCSASARGPRCDAVEVLHHHDRGGQLVAGDGRQDRGPAPGGVVGDERARAGRRRRPGSRGVRPRRRRTRCRCRRRRGRGPRRGRGCPPSRAGRARARRRTAPGTTAPAPPAAGASRVRPRSRRAGGTGPGCGPPPRRPPPRRRWTHGGPARRPRRAGAAAGRRRPAPPRRRGGTRRTRSPCARPRSGRLAGLVDEQHRDVVADGVGEAAARCTRAPRPRRPPARRGTPGRR